MRHLVALGAILLFTLSFPALAAERLIPHPQKMETRDERLRIEAPLRVISGDRAAVDVVTERLRSFQLPVAGPADQQTIACRIELASRSHADPTAEEAQGYEIRIDDTGLAIKAGGPPGLDYALSSLGQLIRYEAHGPSLPHVVIEDAPAMRLRGVYLNLRQVKATDPKSIEVLRDLIDALASLKINLLVIEVSDNLRYDSRRLPAREKTAFSKQQMRELVAYARGRHMEVVPYLQTLSHVSWILSDPANEALLEDPSNKGWHTAWCPSKPATQAFIEDILRETVDVFEPRFFHVGLDEVNWGPYYRCDDCRKRPEPSEIFLDQIMRLHGVLAQKNVRMIMFHDELLEVPNRYSRYSKTAAIVEGWKVLDRLPKDIVLNTYFYSEDRPELKRQVDLFTSKGFQVMGMPFNIFRGIHQSSERMGAEPQALGNILSYWHFAGDWSQYGLAPESFASTTLIADLSWNPATELESLGYDPVWEFSKRWKNLDPARNDQPLASYPLELTGLFNQKVFSTRGQWPATGARVAEDAFTGELVHDDVRVALGNGPSHPNAIVLSGAEGDGFPAEPRTIEVHRQVKGMAFVHACDVPANIVELREKNRRAPDVARYTFVYEDGTRVEQPIQYRVQITDWNNRLAPTDGRAVIATSNEEGHRVMFARWMWINPHPEKVLRHVELKSTQYEKASIAVLAVTALCDERSVVRLDDMSYATDRQFAAVWKMQRSGLPKVPQLTARPDQQAMEVRIPPVGEEQARLILDREIRIDPGQLAERTLSFDVELDHSSVGTIQFGVYLAETAPGGGLGKNAVSYLKLRPGVNHVNIAPQDMKAAGETPDWANVSQLRLSFWIAPKNPEVRLVIGPLEWRPVSVEGALHKGDWYD